MAYMVAIGSCQKHLCEKPAEQKLYNRRNGYIGQFCMKCAQQGVRDLQLFEEHEDLKRKTDGV